MTSPNDLAVPNLNALVVEDLRRAVDVYLSRAYPHGPPPEAVRRRLVWPENVGAEELLTHPPFERAAQPGATRPSIFALRLGNVRYPHMKLQVQAWPNLQGFLLSVNTHDQVFAPPKDSPEYETFRALQEENQRIKLEIETAWENAGLPTFLAYLRDYIRESGSGETQLA